MNFWQWLDKHPVVGVLALLVICMTAYSIVQEVVR